MRFIVYIKTRAKKVAAFIKSKNAATFLFFVLLASILWVMHSSGTTRTLKSEMTIVYTGIPDDVALSNPLPGKLKFEIKDQGKQLWSYIANSIDTLTVDLSNKFQNSGKIDIEFETYLQKSLSHFSQTTKITELTPNYYSSTFVRLKSKEVTVKLSNNISLAPQHVFIDTITISPTSVTIFGPEQKLNAISEIYTEPISETFTKTKTIESRLLLPEGITSNRPSVDVTIPVEISTECYITLPVTFKNVPDGLKIKTFPFEVQAKFNTGLSHYKHIDQSEIEIVFDYEAMLSAPQKSTYSLKAENIPQEWVNFRFTPTEVEYIIETPKQCIIKR